MYWGALKVPHGAVAPAPLSGTLTLQRLQQPDVLRSLKNAGEWSLVPGSTYFNEKLTDKNGQRMPISVRRFGALHDCNVIFDPDNESRFRPQGAAIEH